MFDYPQRHQTHSSELPSDSALNACWKMNLNQVKPKIQAHGSKRIVILCDGTWKEAYGDGGTDQITNVVRLSQAISSQDISVTPYITQVIFYQSGLGTSGDLSLDLAAGATGYGILNKIQEAYQFLVHNWLPGDQIFLFGFSRGAYTARTIGALIADIGILEPTEMDGFYNFFKAYQERSQGDPIKKQEAENYLQDYRLGGLKATRPMPEGTLKCIGVWDTVGALGIPGGLISKKNLLGFTDALLGSKVHYAFHALAIDETRLDFLPTKWTQTEEARQAGQVMKQVWFSGAHSDVGGGYTEHDLSDLTLVWMVANLMEYKLLSINTDYIVSTSSPRSPWGHQHPHNPRIGVNALTLSTTRKLPKSLDPNTQERFHRSVTARQNLTKDLKKTFSETPALMTDLLPLEIQLQANWKINNDPTVNKAKFHNFFEEGFDALLGRKSSSSQLERSTKHEDMVSEITGQSPIQVEITEHSHITQTQDNTISADKNGNRVLSKRLSVRKWRFNFLKK